MLEIYEPFITDQIVICGEYALYRLGLITATVPCIQAWSETPSACGVILPFIEYKYCVKIYTSDCVENPRNKNILIPSKIRALAECLSNIDKFDEGCIFEAVEYMYDTGHRSLREDVISYAKTNDNLSVEVVTNELDSMLKDWGIL